MISSRQFTIRKIKRIRLGICYYDPYSNIVNILVIISDTSSASSDNDPKYAKHVFFKLTLFPYRNSKLSYRGSTISTLLRNYIPFVIDFCFITQQTHERNLKFYVPIWQHGTRYSDACNTREMSSTTGHINVN